MLKYEGALTVLYLLADTSIWLDVAKNISGEQLIAACRVLIHQRRLQLLVPKVVIDEFERNRDRVETDMTRSVTSTFQRVRAAVNEHGRGEGREEALKHIDDLTHRLPLINQMASANSRRSWSYCEPADHWKQAARSTNG